MSDTPSTASAIVKSLVEHALSKIASDVVDLPIVKVEIPADKTHGDYACNIAMQLAKPLKMAPRKIAEQLIEQFEQHDAIGGVEIAGPGFLNFRLSPLYRASILKSWTNGNTPELNLLNDENIIVEYVSANPNGPIHVGHGRGAAYGSAIASLLKAAGANVHREYYVNDAGRQMHILTTSVWLRYLEYFKVPAVAFPNSGYQGQYIIDLAEKIAGINHEQYLKVDETTFSALPKDAEEGDAKEAYISALIQITKQQLGADYVPLFEYIKEAILSTIRKDLSAFGAEYEEWFSEQSLFDDGKIDAALNALTEKNELFDEDGAKWFRSTTYGDDKDRVVIRSDKSTTYFASDIAYHHDKLARGFTRIINVLGADHHGYVPRVKAAVQALGFEADKIQVPLVQFAALYRAGEKISMSTRAGSFVSLSELQTEIGKDAARFFYLMRRADQHLEFDLEVAKAESHDNPLYTIQYAHARICSIFKQLAAADISLTTKTDDETLSLLTENAELALLDRLRLFEGQFNKAVQQLAPHVITHYLQELAHDLHKFYSQVSIMKEENTEKQYARVTLLQGVKKALQFNLSLLGIEAVESM